mgnify:CR=1 FL=1
MVLSFETSIALKSEINEKPKTIIPGVRALISKMAVAPASGGMLLFIIEKSNIKKFIVKMLIIIPVNS